MAQRAMHESFYPMGKSSRASLVSDVHNLKQALAASERRAKRALRRLREIEKVMEPVMEHIRFWAASKVDDSSNAARIMTVGQCRAMVAAFSQEESQEEEEEIAEL